MAIFLSLELKIPRDLLIIIIVKPNPSVELKSFLLFELGLGMEEC